MNYRNIMAIILSLITIFIAFASVLVPSLSASIESSYVFFGDISILSAYIYKAQYYNALTARRGGLSNTRYPPRVAKIISICYDNNIGDDLMNRFSLASNIYEKSFLLYILISLGQDEILKSEGQFVISILLNENDILYHDWGNDSRSDYICEETVKNILMAIKLSENKEYIDIIKKALTNQDFKYNIEINRMAQETINSLSKQ